MSNFNTLMQFVFALYKQAVVMLARGFDYVFEAFGCMICNRASFHMMILLASTTD